MRETVLSRIVKILKSEENGQGKVPASVVEASVCPLSIRVEPIGSPSSTSDPRAVGSTGDCLMGGSGAALERTGIVVCGPPDNAGGQEESTVGTGHETSAGKDGCACSPIQKLPERQPPSRVPGGLDTACIRSTIFFSYACRRISPRGVGFGAYCSLLRRRHRLARFSGIPHGISSSFHVKQQKL